MELYINAALLGLIQGLTEFLPISSSGHLIVVPKLLGWPDQGVIFDITLHVATLSAVLIYFRHDVAQMITGLKAIRPSREQKIAKQTLIYLGIATVPVLGAGLLFADFIETAARNTLVVAALMIFVGLMFIVVEKISIPKKDLSKMTWVEALSVGIAQAAALMPGVSRSGATIIAGMYNSLKREAATRFSFLLAIPAILLAGGYSILKLLNGAELGAYSWEALAIAFVAAVISGLSAIAFMMRYVKYHRLHPFAFYRIAFGVALIVLYYTYGGPLR